MVNLSLDHSEKEMLKRDILHKEAELMRKKLYFYFLKKIFLFNYFYLI